MSLTDEIMSGNNGAEDPGAVDSVDEPENSLSSILKFGNPYDSYLYENYNEKRDTSKREYISKPYKIRGLKSFKLGPKIYDGANEKLGKNRVKRGLPEIFGLTGEDDYKMDRIYDYPNFETYDELR